MTRLLSFIYNKVIIGLSVVLCITLFASCASDDDNDTPEPVPPTKAEQTLLFFFPYADNLTTSSIFLPSDLREIKQFISDKGGLDGYKIIVYWGKSSLSGGATIADLYELKYDNGTFVNDTIEHYDRALQSDKQFLTTMFSKVKSVADTPRIGMITGGHGCGWLPSQLYYGMVSRSFGGTSDAPLRIDIADFSESLLSASLHPEYILFDDCLMNNIEVLYELRNNTDYIIATPAEQPGEGMPYTDIMPYLIGNPQYERIADAFINYYGDFTRYSSPYTDRSTRKRENPGTICITKCSEIDAIATAMKQLNAVTDLDAISNPDRMDIQRMDMATQGIFYDLMSYAEVLSTTAEGTATQLSALSEAVKKATVTAKHGGFYLARGEYCYPITSYCGITISDPSQNDYLTYFKEDTSWWQATH